MANKRPVKNSVNRILTLVAFLAFTFTKAYGMTSGSLTVAVLPVPIPEPSTYAAIFGLASIGFAIIRRRHRR